MLHFGEYHHRLLSERESKWIHMRKDAEQNRKRLLTAASEAMRSKGGDVPMEVFAEKAGVTRGTLYRNFADRQAVYEAVLASDLEELALTLASDSEADPLAFIRLITELMVVYDKFLTSLPDMQDYDKDKNESRMIAVFAKNLAAAKEQNLVRKNLKGTDILTVCRMLASHARLDNPNDKTGNFKQRMKLLLGGIGPS